jgi:phosphoglycerate dehydrogenase-like enzyme
MRKNAMIHVHVLEDFDEPALALLRANLADSVQLTSGSDIPGDTNILIGGRPTSQQLTACPFLQALIVPWAGVPENTRELLRDFPHVTLHNLHHNAAATAEMALALLFAAAKFIVPLDQKLRANDWSPRYAPARSLGLEGKTALIIGYGQIGQRVGRVCHALGMNVIATRRNRVEADALAEVHPTSDLPQLLPRAQFVIITAPLTPETKGLIGERELAALPRGAVLVNVGRGAIVDEGALYHALKHGALTAAGLDVWYNYPKDEASQANTPPAQYPFGELDNVVLSPHRGGDDFGIDVARMRDLAELLNAAARGDEMANRVSLEAGY